MNIFDIFHSTLSLNMLPKLAEENIDLLTDGKKR